MDILAIIPARAGSVGLPHKNRLLLAGKSLVNWALDCALASKHIARVMLNTDDDFLISEIASNPNVDIPFKRHPDLASSEAKTIDVVLDTLNWYEKHRDLRFDAVVLLEPTCPFRTSTQLDEAIELLKREGADTLLSVCPPMQHPADCIYDDDGDWRICLPRKSTHVGRQDFQDAWFINGAFYIASVEWLKSKKTFYDLEHSLIYKMPTLSGIDIDEEIDLEIANVIAKGKKQ